MLEIIFDYILFNTLGSFSAFFVGLDVIIHFRWQSNKFNYRSTSSFVFELSYNFLIACIVMQVSISSITIPPMHPWGFAPKNLPPPGAFASKLLLRGQGFVRTALEGQVFVYKRCLPFLKFSL